MKLPPDWVTVPPPNNCVALVYEMMTTPEPPEPPARQPSGPGDGEAGWSWRRRIGAAGKLAVAIGGLRGEVDQDLFGHGVAGGNL